MEVAVWIKGRGNAVGSPGGHRTGDIECWRKGYSKYCQGQGQTRDTRFL